MRNEKTFSEACCGNQANGQEKDGRLHCLSTRARRSPQATQAHFKTGLHVGAHETKMQNFNLIDLYRNLLRNIHKNAANFACLTFH